LITIWESASHCEPPLALLYGVNMVGIKMSARVLNVLMIIKIGMVLFLIVAIFVAPEAPSAAATAHPVSTGDWSSHSGFVSCRFFTYEATNSP